MVVWYGMVLIPYIQSITKMKIEIYEYMYKGNITDNKSTIQLTSK